MPEYKLQYFDLRALGEPIRFIFVAAGVPYEDDRIPRAQWAEYKSKIPFGKIPVLYVDGKRITQSVAISRFLAKRFDLVSTDPFLDARCDEVGDSLLELRILFVSFFLEKDEKRKAELKTKLAEEDFPRSYGIWNELIAENGGPFVAGKKMTWVDLAIASWVDVWGDAFVTHDFVKKYPAVAKLKETVFAIPAIKEYVATRPTTLA
jgi:glutathione S-transferase